MDSFFSIPDFRISEKIFNLLLDIRAKTKNAFLVQTRNKEHNVLKLALSGNLADFYRTEIKQREDFNFPPFKVFIKITIMGDKRVISKEMKELKKYLEEYSFDIYPGFISKIKGKYILNGLITLDKWPDKNLLDKLLSLPPKFAVNVDPDNLL
jgi:primosomal protein N' (replication factor Y)